MVESVTENEKEQIQAIVELANVEDQEKRDLILVYLNEKKATEIIFPKENRQRREVKRELEALGFFCGWRRYENKRNVFLYVARDKETFIKLMQADFSDPVYHQTWGDFYGYPPTAIEAFSSDYDTKILPRKEEPKEVTEAEWYQMLTFCLSRDHWQTEIQTAQRWYAAVQRVAPDFLRKYCEERAAFSKWFSAEIERQREEMASRIKKESES